MTHSREKVAAMLDVLCGPPNQMPDDGAPLPLRLYDAQQLALAKKAQWSEMVRELHVSFLEPFDPVVAERVVSIITGAFGWNRYCGLQFVFDQSPDADIRISFVRGASWSHLGTECLRVPAGAPTMNFGWLYPDTALVEYHRVVLHEFGHALGFIHEHQSPYMDIPWDYEKVYAYYWKTNGWNKNTVDHNVLNRYNVAEVEASEGDPRSIMCYLIDPLFLTDPLLNIGGNTELSALDKEKAREWYGDPPAKYAFLPAVSGDARG